MFKFWNWKFEKQHKEKAFGVLLSKKPMLITKYQNHVFGYRNKKKIDIAEAMGCVDAQKVYTTKITSFNRQHKFAQNVGEWLQRIIQNKDIYFLLAFDETNDESLILPKYYILFVL